MAVTQEQVKIEVISSAQWENGLQETAVTWVFLPSL
jgi:hypothetical protein